MALGVITITAYEAFGALEVLITHVETGPTKRSYSRLGQERIALADTDAEGIGPALIALADYVWTIAERYREVPF